MRRQANHSIARHTTASKAKHSKAQKSIAKHSIKKNSKRYVVALAQGFCNFSACAVSVLQSYTCKSSTQMLAASRTLCMLRSYSSNSVSKKTD